MNEGFQIIDIIFFAVVAGFILLRLRGALGRRTGHQPPPVQPGGGEETNDNVVQLADREAADEFAAESDGETGRPDGDLDDEDQVLAAGLSQIYDADGVMSFRVRNGKTVWLKVGEEVVLDDGVWDSTTSGAVDFGVGGWFDFEMRMASGFTAGGMSATERIGFEWDRDGGTKWRRA